MAMIKDKEFKIAEHRIYFDAGTNIVYVIADGDADKEIASKIREFTFSIHEEAEGDINTVVDLNKSGKSTPEAREIWKELGDHKRSEKVAFVGLHPVSRVIAGFIMKITSKNNCRFFATREEALQWIHS